MLGRRILLGALVIVNLYLLLTVFWGGSGLFAYLDLKGRHSGLETELKALEEKSLSLSAEIRNLTSNPAYQRQVVRERMNYVGDKEVLYIFPQAGTDPASGSDRTDQVVPKSEADDEQ